MPFTFSQEKAPSVKKHNSGWCSFFGPYKFSMGQKGTSFSRRWQLSSSFLYVLLRNKVKTSKKSWPNLCSPCLIMREANSTSTNSPTSQPFLNPSQGQNLSPLSCMPEQFFTDALNSEAHWSGTRRLLFAVLQDAVACWFRYQRSRSAQGHQLFQEIREWFLTKNRDSLYAFENICTHLNLDAEYFRRGLMSQTACIEQEEWTSDRPGRLTRRRT